jgi:hypothetical protein
MGVFTMRIVSLTLIAAVLVGIAAACSQPGGSTNADSQIQTAIIETSIAEATFQAAVYGAAQATTDAISPPATFTPEPPVDPYTLSEEELVALIDAYYEDAIYNSLDASEVTQEASSDNTISEDEIYAITNYVYRAEASIVYAEDLIKLYEDIYGELASETLDLLVAIEEDLSQLTSSLVEIENILLQGSATASEAINQINAALSSINDYANQALENRQAWRETVQSNLNEREVRFSGVTANDLALDREGAILQVYSYLDSVKAALDDQKISLPEMSQIAQLGANAEASLQEQGGPGLQGIGNAIDGLTRQLARGQWPQAKGGIGGFEASLPQRPARRQ